jgi:hypothetical protein
MSICPAAGGPAGREWAPRGRKGRAARRSARRRAPCLPGAARAGAPQGSGHAAPPPAAPAPSRRGGGFQSTCGRGRQAARGRGAVGHCIASGQRPLAGSARWSPRAGLAASAGRRAGDNRHAGGGERTDAVGRGPPPFRRREPMCRAAARRPLHALGLASGRIYMPAAGRTAPGTREKSTTSSPARGDTVRFNRVRPLTVWSRWNPVRPL